MLTRISSAPGGALEGGAGSDEDLIVRAMRNLGIEPGRGIFPRHFFQQFAVVRDVPGFVEFEFLVEIILIQIRQDRHAPAIQGFAVFVSNHGGREPPVGVVVVV